MLFRGVQALCSYLRGVLCLTAMLHASGVGDGTWMGTRAYNIWSDEVYHTASSSANECSFGKG